MPPHSDSTSFINSLKKYSRISFQQKQKQNLWQNNGPTKNNQKKYGYIFLNSLKASKSYQSSENLGGHSLREVEVWKCQALDNTSPWRQGPILTRQLRSFSQGSWKAKSLKSGS